MSDAFEVQELALSGVFLIRPRVYTDPRGLSVVPYAAEEFAALGITSRFAQDYTSRSVRGCIRGLHYQKAPRAQDKLVRCSWGRIFDVAADIDPGSATFGTYVSTTLSGDEQSLLFVPGKYAHGFCVISEEAVTEYKMSDVYSTAHAGGVRWDDPTLKIAWPTKEPVFSQQDQNWPILNRL